MKITSIQPSQTTKISKKIPHLGIFRLKLSKDNFEKRTICATDKSKNKDVTGFLEKNIILKTTDGEYIKGCIIKDIEDKNTFYACADDEKLCEMIVQNYPGNSFQVRSLQGQNNQGEYKGAGTELLKLAAEKSKKFRHDGELELVMTGSFLFYYKNNFRANKKYKGYEHKNAFLDYAFRNNIDITKLPKHNENNYISLMYLDKQGADALLKGERLCDTSASVTLFSKERQDKVYSKIVPYDIDLAEVDENKSVLQIIEKEPYIRQVAYIILNLQNDGGKKRFEIADDCIHYIQKNDNKLNDFYEKELTNTFEIIQGYFLGHKIS